MFHWRFGIRTVGGAKRLAKRVFKNVPFPASLLIAYSTVNNKHVLYKILSMIEIKPRTSGIGSDHCPHTTDIFSSNQVIANCWKYLFCLQLSLLCHLFKGSIHENFLLLFPKQIIEWKLATRYESLLFLIAIPSLFLLIFGLFKQQYNFVTNKCKESSHLGSSAGIQTHNNFNHESHTITTRLGLLSCFGQISPLGLAS